jgi:altronate dehydratase
MEPLTTGAIAVATVLATKALEKIGENIGDTLSHQTQQFLELLKQRLPGTFAAIEQAPEQPLNYGQAVLEIETAAKTDTNIRQAIQELVAAAKAAQNPKIADILATPNLEKLADKIGMVVMSGGTVTINTMNF